MVANNGSNGASRSEVVANPTAGGVGVAKIESSVLVANLENSPQNGNQSTKETKSLSREQSLQILRDCVEMVRKDEVAIQISNFTSKTSGKTCTIILLENVEYANDDFVYTE